MTLQEIIEWLKSIKEKYIHGGDEDFDKKRKIAIDIAISALEKKIPKNPKTNFERIKAMSIDEMVEFLEAAGDSPCTTICNNFDRCRLNGSIERICKNHFKQWLESEVEEE